MGTSADVRAVAFGASPGLLARIGPGASARDRWLAAVAWGGQGRYAVAAAELHRLRHDPATPPAIRAHATVTLAAHRRQLGGHAAAQVLDGVALRWAAGALAGGVGEVGDADGTDLSAARIDALIGLAADSVGLGRPLVAHSLLDSAELSCRDHPSWRLPIRVGWVRAEAALLGGDPAAALASATAAAERAMDADSIRHRVKSLIVQVVATVAAGARSAADGSAELDGLAADCVAHGLAALRWPSLLASADMIIHTGDDANDATTRMAQRSASGGAIGSARRRHAALLAMSAIERRCDPPARRLIRVSMRPLGWTAVTSLLHSDSRHPHDECHLAQPSRMEGTKPP